MGSFERRLLRKQINRKLYHMSNHEALENDFLTSSQIITERQQMYMVIAKNLRSKDNARTKKKNMPFMLDKSCLPHVNAARINRLLNSTEEILNNSKEIDLVIKAHSFRTSTPYYNNPQLTIDRGNFTNYSKHVGALLHTPRYIQYLKNIQRPRSSKSSQKSYQEKTTSVDTTGKSVESLRSRESISSKSKSSTKTINTKSERSNSTRMPIDGEFSNVSRSISPSSKMSIVSNVKSGKSQGEDSQKSFKRDYQIPKSETEIKKDECQTDNDEIIDKPPSYHESFSPKTDDMNVESLSENTNRSLSQKSENTNRSLSQKSENTNRSLSQKSDLERKSLSSNRRNEISITGINDERQNTPSKGSDEPSSLNDTSLLDNDENYSETLSENSSKSSSPKPHINLENNENILSSKGNSEISIKKIDKGEDAVKDGSYETNVISRKRSKEENHNYISTQLEIFLENNEITKDDFNSMERYFDTVHHFRHRRPVYVSDYCKFLTDQKREKFILFAEIFNEYAIETMTDEEAIEIKMILKKYEEKLKESNNKIENDEEGTLINYSQNVSNVEDNEITEQKEEHKDDILCENEHITIDKIIDNKITGKESITEDPNIDYCDSTKKNLSNEQILNEGSDSEREEPEFSELFQRLFRASMSNLAKEDIDILKNLVAEYQLYNQQVENNEINIKESDEREENEDYDFSNSFHTVFRNSISEIKEENISDFQKLVEKLEISDRNRIISEDSDIDVTKQVNLVRRISEADISEGNKGFPQTTINDDKRYSSISFDQEDRVSSNSDDSSLYMENEEILAFRNLFRNSIDKITGKDLEKINKWLEKQEKVVDNNNNE